ncbi:Phd Finger Protein 13 [Manis pentadactyla]|nr:Phd Finger Protein 13 [Manis pentadactyla]
MAPTAEAGSGRPGNRLQQRGLAQPRFYITQEIGLLCFSTPSAPCTSTRRQDVIRFWSQAWLGTEKAWTGGSVPQHRPGGALASELLILEMTFALATIPVAFVSRNVAFTLDLSCKKVRQSTAPEYFVYVSCRAFYSSLVRACVWNEGEKQN